MACAAMHGGMSCDGSSPRLMILRTSVLLTSYSPVSTSFTVGGSEAVSMS